MFLMIWSITDVYSQERIMLHYKDMASNYATVVGNGGNNDRELRQTGLWV